MSIHKYFTKKNLTILGIILMLGVVFCAYWLHTLRLAHSTFESYYTFRGCTELLEKHDAYALCKVHSGATIKLVRVGTKWFLDGDLGW